MLQLLDLNKKKIGGLTKYKDYYIEKEISGDKKLYFKYPIDEAFNILEEFYIRNKTDEFIIKEISDDSDYYHFVALLNLEDLEGKPWEHFDSTERSLTDCLNLILAGTGWTVGVCNIARKRTVRKTNCSSLDLIKEAMKRYRAEVEYDTLNKRINVYEKVGSDKGAYFIDSLNLKALNVQSNSYDFYTKLIAKGKGNLRVEVENFQYSRKVKTYIWVDERYTRVDSITEDAIAKLENLSKPYKSYQADIIDLARMNPEYKDILSYGLGDTIELISKKKKIKDKQRIVKIVEYPDEPERNTCEIANMSLTFEELQRETQDAVDTVDNITTDNGTIKGEAIDGISTSQIIDFDVEVGKVVDFSAINARIDNLQANKADIGSLNAAVARIGQLEATKATITDLNAAKAEITQLKSTKAEISQLEATNAKVNVLEVDTANIKNLLAGNITGESGHLIHLTAQNVVIDDAVIKDLIASNIKVSDLMAGTISTNHFRIASDSGKMLIADNTIQISDNTKVRVQIGKDSSGDYNMYVWDSAGKLMFDATGLKADGIKNSIIRDDMISPNANISGGKINIGSLITEVNKDSNTQTIKSSKVQLDAAGQTLEIAFNTLKTNVGNIEVGGRNFVKNSNFAKDAEDWALSSTNAASIDKNVKYEESNTLRINLAGRPSDVWSGALQRDVIKHPIVGEYYTVSFMYLVKDKSKLDSGFSVEAKGRNISGTPVSIGGYRMIQADSIIENQWTKYVYTFKLTNKEAVTIDIFPWVRRNGDVWITNIKFERGTKATDWIPASEDLESRIESNTTTINAQQGSIETLIKDTIIEESGNTVKLKDAYSSLKQTVSGINSTVASHSSSLSSLDSKINTTNGSVSSLTGKVTAVENKQTTFEQNLNSITQRVTSSESSITNIQGQVNTANSNITKVDDKINNLQVGGRNLFINSDFTKTLTNSSWETDKNPNLYPVSWSSYNSGMSNANTLFHAHIDNDTFKMNVIEFNESNGSRNWKAVSQNLRGRLTRHDKYILSLDAYATGEGTVLFGGFYYYRVGESTMGFNSGQYRLTDIPVNKWGRCSIQVPLKDDIDFSKDITFYIYGYGFSSNSICYIDKVKLEAGTKATDWSPAPEDVDTNIATVDNKVINLTATVETTKNKVSEIVTNLDSITQRVASTESTTVNLTSQVNTANSTANNALSTANSATSKADQAQSTANNVNNKVDNLQVGGRNLMRNTSDFENLNYWATNGGITAVIEDGCIKTTKSLKHEFTLLEADTEYTIEATFKSDYVGDLVPIGAITPLHMHVFCDENSEYNNYLTKTQIVVGEAYAPNKFTTYRMVFRTRPNITNIRFRFMIYQSQTLGANNSTIWLKRVKLEKGNKATDYTKAPEDIDANISAVDDKVITITAEVNTTKDKVAELKTSLDGITQRVSSTETNVTKITATANSALGTANSANDKINSLSIGGENIYLGTKDFYNGASYWGNFSSWTKSSEVYNDLVVMERSSAWMGLTHELAVKAGEEYVISFYGKVEAGGTIVNVPRSSVNGYADSVGLSVIGGNFISGGYWITSSTDGTNWKRFYAIIRVTQDLTMQLRFENGISNKKFSVCGIKLERGNKPTDWCPAPQDIDNDISSVDDKVTLVNVEVISTKNKVAQIETTVNGISQKVQSTETNVTTLTGKVNTANNNISTLQGQINTVNNSINNLQIGGRNLIKNSLYKKGSENWSLSSGIATIDNETLHNGHKTVKIQKIGVTTSTWGGIRQDNVIINPKQGEMYTLSYWYLVKDKTTLNDIFALELKGRTTGGTDTWLGYTSISPTTVVEGEWTKVSFVLTINRTDLASIFLYGWARQSGVIWFSEIKAEKGNKATDFTEAPEDIDSSIKDVEIKVITTNEKISSIESNLDSITSKVSNVEKSVTTINGNISSLSNRMTTAESKITSSAIINTVSSTIQTAKNEAINSANSATDAKLQSYATTSSVTQTVNSWVAKFTEIGGSNLLLNGRPRQNTAHWFMSHNENNANDKTLTMNGGNENWSNEVFKSGIWWKGTKATDGGWCCLFNESIVNFRFSTKKKYSISFIIYNGQGTKNVDVNIINSDGSNSVTGHNINLELGYQFVSFEFTPARAGNMPCFGIYLNTPGFFNFYIPWVVVKEGTPTTNWTGNANEIREGSTIIDASGITVFNGGLTLKNNKSQDVLKGDSNGNLTLNVYDSKLTISATGDRKAQMWCDYYDKFILQVPYTRVDGGLWIKRDTGATILSDLVTADNAHYKVYIADFQSPSAKISNLYVTGTKNCLQQTELYGDRLINAYETAEYYFGDIGSGIIRDGECIIFIDEILKGCINTNIEYHVFTQVYEGAITKIERFKDYFVVYGTEGTNFSWELKAKRLGYENVRLDTPDEIDTTITDYLFTLLDEEDHHKEVASLENTLLGGSQI